MVYACCNVGAIFHASHRTNYTIEAFTLLVQEKYISAQPTNGATTDMESYC